MNDLPLELRAHICDYLGALELAQIRATGHVWYDAVLAARDSAQKISRWKLDQITCEKLREIYCANDAKQPGTRSARDFCDLMIKRGVLQERELDGAQILDISENTDIVITDPIYLCTMFSLGGWVELYLHDPVSGENTYLTVCGDDCCMKELICVMACDKIDGVWPIFKAAEIKIVICACENMLFILEF